MDVAGMMIRSTAVSGGERIAGGVEQTRKRRVGLTEYKGQSKICFFVRLVRRSPKSVDFRVLISESE